MGKKNEGKKAATNRTEFRFVMDAYTPATIPMARLGAYLSELATLMGEPTAVHFRDLVEGSTIPLIDVEFEAVPKVRARLEAVAQNDGPTDAANAEKAINRLLREDNATGRLQLHKARTPILKFPGRLERIDRPIGVRQHGTVDGKLVRIGGTDQTIHAILQSEGQQITRIDMSEAMAKQLAPKLFEYVRLIGHGRWQRDSDGTWTLEHFKVESFEPLTNAPLSKALVELRDIGSGWEKTKDAYGQLSALRGKKGEPDARH